MTKPQFIYLFPIDGHLCYFKHFCCNRTSLNILPYTCLLVYTWASLHTYMQYRWGIEWVHLQLYEVFPNCLQKGSTNLLTQPFFATLSMVRLFDFCQSDVCKVVFNYFTLYFSDISWLIIRFLLWITYSYPLPSSGADYYQVCGIEQVI